MIACIKFFLCHYIYSKKNQIFSLIYVMTLLNYSFFNKKLVFLHSVFFILNNLFIFLDFILFLIEIKCLYLFKSLWDLSYSSIYILVYIKMYTYYACTNYRTLLELIKFREMIIKFVLLQYFLVFKIILKKIKSLSKYWF